MKSKTQRWSLSATLTLTLFVTLSWAGPFPVEVVTNIAGVSHETAPSFQGAPFTGSARFGVDDMSYEDQASSTPLVLVGADNEGAWIATSSHVFKLADGLSLHTVDELHLHSTRNPDWFTVSGTLTISGGTGLFATARGAMDVMGTLHITEAGVETLFLLEGPLIYWLS
jgi:hypothetical protein